MSEMVSQNRLPEEYLEAFFDLTQSSMPDGEIHTELILIAGSRYLDIIKWAMGLKGDE